MNLYDLWRYFGPLPLPPEIVYTSDSNAAFSHLADSYHRSSDDSDALASLVSFALRFSRLDGLKKIISEDAWAKSPAGLIFRSRLRFFRALAERPEEPDSEELDEAADDFFKAVKDVPSDAKAGLIRIMALKGDFRGAEQALRRLILFGGRSAWPAAAGACLFLADSSGTPMNRRRSFFVWARRLLARSKGSGVWDSGSALISALVDGRLGRTEACLQRLESLSTEGNREAQYLLLQQECQLYLKNPVPELQARLFESISRYKKLRPSDARIFVLEGDLFREEDLETANIAWRSALILNERNADAWSRLGNLYRDIWGRDDDGFRENWLENARDAFTKAVFLNPLDSFKRTDLGMVERDSGHSANSVAVLRGSLALNDTDDTARRWLAMSWLDLSFSADLDAAARRAAAERAGEEWMCLLKEDASSFDMLGYIRSLVLSGDRDEKLKILIKEIEADFKDYNPEDLVILAEDCITMEERDLASYVLDLVESELPEEPHVHALRGALAVGIDPVEAVNRYLKAVNSVNPDDASYCDWLIAASVSARSATGNNKAEMILREGLKKRGAERSLLRSLASLLLETGRGRDALGEYRKAVGMNPDDTDLLEDAVWFGREADLADEAEFLLREGLQRRPEDSRLWNQLGIHLMESGWDEAAESMRKESLDNAIDAYRKAVDLFPENRVYLGNLGDALRQAGRWTESAELLNRAVKETKDSEPGAFAINALARLEDETSYTFEGSDEAADDWVSAGIHYRKAAEVDGENVDYLKDYAWWLYRERRIEQALEVYLRAEDLRPSDESIPYGIFSCRLDLGDEERAVEDLERALALKPDDPVFLADKADLIASLGDFEEADALYGRVVEIAENASWVWERRAELRERGATEVDDPVSPPLLPTDTSAVFDWNFVFHRERTAEGDRWRYAALEAWKRISDAEPDNSRISGCLGAVLMDLGQMEEARKLLEASLAQGVHLRYAETMDRLGRLDMYEALLNDDEAKWVSAGERFASAVFSDSLTASYHADEGYRYWLKRDFGAAAESFLRAHDREPKIPEYAANAGFCASAAGRYEEAEVLLRRALTLGGHSGEWENALGLVLMALGETTGAIEVFRMACLSNPESDLFAANLTMAQSAVYIPKGPIQ